MSKDLTVRFANDMSPTAVEVVSPDYQTVARLMLDAGQQAKVRVPSEDSFLRVHLPSGKVITLTDERGQLRRFVSKASLEAAQGIQSTQQSRSRLAGAKSIRDVSQYHMERSDFRNVAPPESVEAGESVMFGPGVTGRLLYRGVEPVKAKLNMELDEASWELNFDLPVEPASRLMIEYGVGQFYALLPANTRTVYARVDQIKESEALLISVRLASRQPESDAILGYLERGDLYAAEAMVTWVMDASEMLAGKVEDPYAAAVGAYLLLKLRRFDLLHTWVKNLADWFHFLPDGCVLWAWQQIYQNPSNKNEIRDYLLKAVSRERQMTEGLPVYSQGLRLLFDGLSMLSDSEAQAASEELRRVSGAVLWDSPVTAGCKVPRGAFTRSNPVIFDVSFMT